MLGRVKSGWEVVSQYDYSNLDSGNKNPYVLAAKAKAQGTGSPQGRHAFVNFFAGSSNFSGCCYGGQGYTEAEFRQRAWMAQTDGAVLMANALVWSSKLGEPDAGRMCDTIREGGIAGGACTRASGCPCNLMLCAFLTASKQWTTPQWQCLTTLTLVMGNQSCT